MKGEDDYKNRKDGRLETVIRVKGRIETGGDEVIRVECKE